MSSHSSVLRLTPFECDRQKFILVHEIHNSFLGSPLIKHLFVQEIRLSRHTEIFITSMPVKCQ